MFSTFQGFSEPSSSGTLKESKPTRGLHACGNCKRRKIRCDGRKPCNQCESRDLQARCVYTQQIQRVVPSKRTVETLSKSLKERDAILLRLFPNHSIPHLALLSDQELREAVLHGRSTDKVLPSPSDSTPQRSVTQDSQWDEERRERDPLPAEADDVNALSLPFDRQASYLGISSIRAALAAMLQVRPQLRGLLASRQAGMNNNIARNDEVRPCYHPSRSLLEHPCIKWNSKGQALVDAYFQRIHIFTPMLDETSFRMNYLGSQRQDSPWLALLNMVLAMGSIVSSKSSDRDHCKYYTEAMRHLDLNAFGSSSIETLQALALAGGYYLHYINRPNRGNAILGAAFRMASALGFHRESSQKDGDGNQFEVVEVRRRTWWSLVCLDTWTTTTLGRPSFGRFSPSIDIQLPKLGIDGGEENFQQDMGMTTLIENIRFCRIATEIQDSLAVTPVLNATDRDRFDEALINWHSQLPSILSKEGDCDEPVHLARCIMRWRYWNLRMLLYRPALLDATTNHQTDQEVDQDAIENCQQLSKIAIEDIAKTWLNHQMSGWNAVWFLYQAAMIPLLSMLWKPQSASVPEWRNQVHKALGLFEEMQNWSLTARCSKGVVSQIFETSCDLMRQGEQSCLEQDMNDSKCFDQGADLWADGLEVDDVLNMLCQDWSWDTNCTWTEDGFVDT
ncbi:lactose regulatory [Fusarium subglutinans]|uniref:Lactose regulatory n=1 Tax=Gibberella subglutinans TaxID=42677 RepID=A0A8H5KMG6_GIBSU|nr:lactose regulatory [Fusarium subglutinans]KAF5575051.1 lactose regulatory [Fusarium subglutinans]